jgi:hypothetical protein
MARIVVSDERRIDGRDAAEIWAQVADLSRFGEWFPVHTATSMTGEVPQVGNIIFLSIGRRRDPADAIRLEVCEWEAGRRFACEVREIPGIAEGVFTVEVKGAASGGTNVVLQFVGEGDAVSGQISGYEIGRRFRRALNRLAS